jgi:hypothetical protein
LGAIAPEEMASPLVDALRWGDTAALAEIPHATPLDRSIRFVVTALAVGGLATSMTEGMLAMAETLALPEIIDQLRMNLAQDEQDLIAMHALLESLLADASSGRMRPAA